MKVGVGFFGIPRGHQLTIEAIDAYLRVLEQNFEVHVRYHLFAQTRVFNPRSGEDGPLPPAAYAHFRRFEGVLEPPGDCLRAHDFDRVAEAGDAYGDDWVSLRNLVHQLHSLSNVTTQLEEVSPDAVLFLRPDLLYHRLPHPDLIRRVGRRGRICIVPPWQWWGGVNDRFALCGRSSYRQYGHRIRDIRRYVERTGRPLHGESLLRYSLLSSGATIRTDDIRASRVRLGNRVHDESFDSRETLQGDWRLQMLFRSANRLPWWWPWP